MRPALIPPVLALAWGLNWPAVKTMLGHFQPFGARAVGLGAGALLLIGLALLRGRPLRLPRGDGPALWVGGLLTVAMFNTCTAFAQITTSTSRAAVLTFTMPIQAAVLAWLFLGERPDRRSAIALALGVAGVAVLAGPVLRGVADGQAGWGLALPVAAAFAWAAGTVATKRWPPRGDRIALTAWQLLIGAALCAVAALARGEALPAAWPPALLLAMAWHVFIATAVAYVLWYQLLASASATVSSLTTLAVPVVGVLGAMALIGERPGGSDWIGFALVLGGAAVMVLRLAPRPAAA